MLSNPNEIAILVYSWKEPEISFKILKIKLKITDGNLSSSLIKLEKKKYIEILKGYTNKKPITKIKITNSGLDALRNYAFWFNSVVSNFPLNCEKSTSGEEKK